MYQESEQVVGYIIRNQFLAYRKKLNDYVKGYAYTITISWLDFLKDYVKTNKKFKLKEELGYYFIGLTYDESLSEELQKETLDFFLTNSWLAYVSINLSGYSLDLVETLLLDVTNDSNFLYKRYVIIEGHIADENDYADEQYCNPKKKSLFTVEDIKTYFDKNDPLPIDEDPIFKDSIFRGATNTVNEGITLVNLNENLLGKSVAIQFRYLGKELKKEFEKMDIHGSFNRTSALLKSRVFLSDIKAAIAKESAKKPDIL